MSRPARPFGRVISLSHVHDPATTPIFPGDPEFRAEVVATIDDDGYYLRYVHQGEHTGTHWGAPIHFRADGLAAHELDPEDLVLPAVKVDVREQCAAAPGYLVTVDDLRAWEALHGRIPDGSAVIAWTGWDAKWGRPEFTGRQPGFALETLTWLLHTGRLGERGALGIDTFGPDGADPTYAVSKLLYGAHRISLECLAGLAELPETGAWIVAGGAVHRDGSGSPATIFALLPQAPP
ncbi:cyclase family protein [Nocardia puris]|uniref:Kynurenine formamidase n=1 Tax=Nocardia puris TaxID=208602 RepID=A0A366DBF6_9NOCA|nr:cyclase family protein [Nocardia puris]MBF6214596.1 cyclase family protein [Nocardia puris]MBF6366005.1 cyclase family protein [Nocardia puris]MBF6460352.1 cyclase family protein [Nocardia puris]RBO87346.1 kynurenine formamidase [Nocardia puris]